MRIQVAYDSDGRILTAIPSANENSGTTMHIVQQSGANVGHFDVPREFEGNEFRDFVHLVKVDTVTMQLTAADPGLLALIFRAPSRAGGDTVT